MNNLILCAIAFFVCRGLTPAVERLAWRLGAVDVPLDGRRMHRHSTARCGGLAIFVALGASALLAGLDGGVRGRILAGAWVMLAVGLADDICAITPWQKLAGQLAAAYIASGGMRIGALLWIVLICNAYNLIDGMDGLLAGCAVIGGTALAWILMLMGEGELARLCLLLACACAGFWTFNRAPARIFAGDCGSCTVGYLLGACSLPLLESSRSVSRGIVPLLLFAYPLTDLFTSVARRFLRLQSPFRADRGHFHHYLYATGLTVGQCTWVLHLLSLCLSTVAILLQNGEHPMLASIGCLMAVAWMIAVRIKILFLLQKNH